MEPTTSTSEAEWLAALRVGEAAAFERLVREFGVPILAVCERLLFNYEDAREATQEVFLAAFRSISTFDGRSQLATWLHRIAINTALMKLRSKRRRPERSIEELLPTFLADGHRENPGGAWTESVLEIVQRDETCELVRAKIKCLPESYRTVLVLRDIEELQTQVVAELLGMSPSAVKVRLHRARQALRTLLAPLMGESST